MIKTVLRKKFCLSTICFLLSLPLISTRITSQITLDDDDVSVYFNDGDTFKILEGEYKGSSVRIAGFNSLETYGPVHGWMENTPEYLLEVANKATKEAQKGGWTCKLESGKDAYGRLLATCDDLALAQISKGLAHAYSIDSKPAKKSYVTAQGKSQKRKLGMWKGGTPEFVITSLHSVDEGSQKTYNRMISAKDGHNQQWQHEESYGTCENVCLEQDNSCMVYVPFEHRYKSKPDCLYKAKS